MRRVGQTFLLGGLVLGLFCSPAAAQLIPWHEPPGLITLATPPVSAPPGPTPAVRAKLAKRFATLRLEEPVALPLAPSEISLSSFGGGGAGGAVLPGTTWEGSITQNYGSITVGGSARDDNGWGASGLTLDATGMNYIAITAQRDAGNLAPSLFIQFEDSGSRTQVFSVSTSAFAVGVPTTVHIPIGSWTINFGSNAIEAWNIGGGGLGYGESAVPFRMTFDQLSFTASAIPEPATYAAILSVVALALVGWKRFRVGSGRRPTQSSCAPYLASGSVKVNVAPLPGSLRAEILPP